MPDEELNQDNPEENESPPDNSVDENGVEEQPPDSESTDDSGAENIKEPSMESPASDSVEDVKASEGSEPSNEDIGTEDSVDDSGADDIKEPSMESPASDSPENAGTSEESKSSSEDSGAEASTDDAGELSQDEIDAAFNAVNGSSSEDKSSSDERSIELSQDEIEAALNGENSSESPPERADAGLQQSVGDNINIVKPKEFENFGGIEKSGEEQNIDILLDVTLPVAIELGRTSMPIHDILNLGPGSVVELNRLAGEPVDLLVNDKLIARGEVVVVDENFGVRITSMVSPEERLKGLV